MSCYQKYKKNKNVTFRLCTTSIKKMHFVESTEKQFRKTYTSSTTLIETVSKSYYCFQEI